MESTDTPRSALDELKAVTFKQGMRGYSITEVDDFLDRAASDYEKVRDKLAQQHQQLRQAAERIAQLQSGASAVAPAVAPAPVAAPASVAPISAFRDSSGEIAEMIAMAQHFVAEAKSEAEAKARDLTHAAQERAREIVAEAKSRAEDEVTRLNGLKQRLSEEISSLSTHLEANRSRLMGVIGEIGQRIESSMRVGTSSSDVSAPPTHVTPLPVSPPPAPPAAPSAVTSSQTIGQVLNFETNHDERP